MAICNNPDCPHKERTGRSAEYRDGITTCPECGATLTTAPVNFFEKTEKANKDLLRKVLSTIGPDYILSSAVYHSCTRSGFIQPA